MFFFLFSLTFGNSPTNVKFPVISRFSDKWSSCTASECTGTRLSWCSNYREPCWSWENSMTWFVRSRSWRFGILLLRKSSSSWLRLDTSFIPPPSLHRHYTHEIHTMLYIMQCWHYRHIKYSLDFLRPIKTAEVFEAVVWLADFLQQTWPQTGCR